MIYRRRGTLDEQTVFAVLGNTRRRVALRYVSARRTTVELGELATAIAAAETGETPPPPRARASVAASLRQTHLPMLVEYGIVDYDAESGVVSRRPAAKRVHRYAVVEGPLGLTWAELYRTVGVGGLAATVGSLAGVPGVAALDPLAWGSASLAAFAVATAVHIRDARNRPSA